MQLFNASSPGSTANPCHSHLSWPWCSAGWCIEKLNVVLMLCPEHVLLPAHPVYGAKEKKDAQGRRARSHLVSFLTSYRASACIHEILGLLASQL